MATHVLGLSGSNYAATQKEYSARVEDDRVENHNRDQLDSFAGFLTASFCDTFYVSGALAPHLGQGSVVGGEYYGGLRYNPGPARHITKVTAVQRMSGSGDITTVDVQKIASGAVPTSNESLFVNAAAKCNFTASQGDGVVAETSAFAAGSSSWAAGELLGVVLDAVTSGPSADLTVQVWWKPSASYG